MMAGVATVDGLRREWPDWSPWLGVVEQTQGEASSAAWDRLVPEKPSPRHGAEPLIATAAIVVARPTLRGWLERLFVAASAGGPRMAAAAEACARGLDPAALFLASLAQDRSVIDRIAAASGSDVDMAAFESLAALVPVPFLHACRRKWGTVSGWAAACCPVCGAWAAFREEHAGESLEDRCGRCGSGWPGRLLCCSYCGTTDHQSIVSLVPAETPTRGTIAACSRCKGYLKTFQVLQPCPAPEVMLKDLASVDLDVAAVTQGYRRPAARRWSIGWAMVR